MNRLALIDSIRHFLAEDIGSGDLTSESIFSDDQSGHARFIARAAFISAGMGQVAGEVFRLCNGAMVCTAMADGARVKAGEVLFTAAGPVIDLLRAERVALNLVQRLCGSCKTMGPGGEFAFIVIGRMCSASSSASP